MKFKNKIDEPHTYSVEEILEVLQTNAETGLNNTEAAKRKAKYGPNIYTIRKPKSIWIILLDQFKSPIVYLLVCGVLVSFYFDDIIEAYAILAVIFMNAIIGFSMEMQARLSMKALKEMDIVKTKVFREGKMTEIPSENLTYGDIVLLESGDLIPGDGRLVESLQLHCDESSLTGESLPSEKNTEKLPKNATVSDRFNMVYKGSSVMNGKGKAVITGIAEHTELGTITSLVENAAETATPLDKKLNLLSKKLILLTLVLILIFAVSGYMEGKEWVLIIKTSIALAVAAFPEGLPIVSTVALSYGMLQMAKHNAIVKKLSSVETLGSTNVILTDKTGTLTENKIYVDTFSFPEEHIKIGIEKNTLKFYEGNIEKSQENFEKLILAGALCNDAVLKKGKLKADTGDPIEIALIHLANASGLDAAKFDHQYERIMEMPFNAVTKIMGTLHKNTEGNFVAAKGAVEYLLEKCGKIQFGSDIRAIEKKDVALILAESEKMAAQGLRMLAFAYREEKSITESDFLHELIYLGMVGFLDPPRLDVKKAILSCRDAGIKIVMITGDHPLTALNIAKKVGLVDEAEENVMVGKDIPPMKSLTKEWKDKILSMAVFARTTPKQKLEIAEVFQKAGNIVAMTGDGVNDAPALKKADVGIAMGLRGTQVAKETASIILKDDKFSSIVAAIAFGRVIFKNIQKFVIYLVSCNLSEIFIVTLLGIAAPAATLLPLQILFLNMVTDVFPALALGLGKGEKSLMTKPPRNPSSGILVNKDWIAIAIYAIIMTLSVTFAVYYCKLNITADSKVLNNVAFITLAFSQLFHVFNMSSFNSGFWKNDITQNKFVWLAVLICSGFMVAFYCIPHLRLVLGLSVLSWQVWAVSIAASLIPLFVIQIYKVIWGKKIPLLKT